MTSTSQERLRTSQGTGSEVSAVVFREAVDDAVGRGVDAVGLQEARPGGSKAVLDARRQHQGGAGADLGDAVLALDPGLALAFDDAHHLEIGVGVGAGGIAGRRDLNADADRRRARIVADDGLIGGAVGERLLLDVFQLDDGHVRSSFSARFRPGGRPRW